MKKIILSVLLASSLVMAADEAQIKQEINDVEAKIQELNESLKQLNAQLPSTVVKRVVKDEKADNPFLTHSELGYISTSGNSDTETFNVDATITKNWGPHIVEFSLLTQYAAKDSIEIKNKLLSELKYDYDITSLLSFVYLVGYKDDKFSGFEYQFYTGPGAKYKIIKSAEHKLSLEGNLLYSVDSIQDTYSDGLGNRVLYPFPAGSISDNNGYNRSYAAYRAKAVYNWQMYSNLAFDQIFSYRSEFSDLGNYFIYTKTAFSSKLSDIFSAGISYQIDYTNQPAFTKESTDKTFTFNLIIDY